MVSELVSELVSERESENTREAFRVVLLEHSSRTPPQRASLCNPNPARTPSRSSRRRRSSSWGRCTISRRAEYTVCRGVEFCGCSEKVAVYGNAEYGRADVHTRTHVVLPPFLALVGKISPLLHVAFELVYDQK